MASPIRVAGFGLGRLIPTRLTDYAVIDAEVWILFTFLQHLLRPRLLARLRLPGVGRRSRTVDSGRDRRPRPSDRAGYAVPAAPCRPTARVPGSPPSAEHRSRGTTS